MHVLTRNAFAGALIFAVSGVTFAAHAGAAPVGLRSAFPHVPVVAPIPQSSYAPRSRGGYVSVRYRRPTSRGRAVGARPFTARPFAVTSSASGTLLLNAPFNGSPTTPNRYAYAGATCMTSGTSTTPPTSIPACGTSAPLDPNYSGALQLTPPLTNESGFLVTNPSFSTAAGLVITFTDYSFGGSTPSADGVAFFLSDAGKAEPTAPGQFGGSLGYANNTNGPGIANAYIGVGLDEYGNFSNPTEGRNGGPGPVAETVAVRGAASTNWQYLTGAKNASGVAASLPFNLDSPTATTRPANAPTVQITLTPAGVLSVAIDFHDGNGFLNDIPPTNIVGLAGQPAVPASVHLGFTSSTGGATSRHQIGGLTVATIGASVGGGGGSQDNVTYHSNNLRTGWYQNETTLTASNVASGAFHLIKTLTTAGKSYSQPLYLSNQQVADGSTHNLVIVTDSTDVVYAYDADTLALVWTRDFKNAAAGVRQQLASDIGCDDTWPNIGINGTPVVDRGRNRMYVVVPTVDGSTPHLRLHALSLANGSDATTPVEVSGSVSLASGGTASILPQYNFDRAALLETNNTVYVPLSDHCDFNSDASHGWLLSYNPDTLAQTASLVNTTDKDLGTIAGVRFLGSIWQGGFGIAADAQSNVFFSTGNGPNDGGGSDYGMSVLKVPPTLNFAQRSFFTPSTWQGESQSDTDLGSGGVMLLPDQTTGTLTHLAIAGGKSGEKYLLNRDNLGGLNSSDQIPFETNTAGGIWGGPAYYIDGTGTQKILYGGSPNLNAYTLKTAPYGLTLTSATNVGSLENRNGGVTPVVSSNGTQPGTAVVWAIKDPPGNVNPSGPISLYAFDGANLANTLFTATAGQWTGNGNTGGAMITPLVANGRVYLATDGQFSVFGTK